ncbi:MAG TPA: ATP-binding protein [Streptosporangiaceae bacterium]
MRRRLLLSTLAVAVVAVLLLGIPLAYTTNQLIYEEVKSRLSGQATTLVKEVQLAREQGKPINGREIAAAYDDREIVITLPDGTTVEARNRPPGKGPLITRSSSGGGVRVQVSQRADVVQQDAARQLALISGLVVLGIAVAVGLAVLQARKLTLPLIDLAETADRLGSGNARPRHRRYGVPEVDRVAEVLDSSAVRIADLLAASREFASDASHQLRTPLTALSMRLEEIVEAADYPDLVREEGAAALAQTERLAAVVEQLLARARQDRTSKAGPSKIDEIVDQQTEEWRPIFHRAGREIRLMGERGLVAVVSPEALSQTIATLLDNSLVHGDGLVTVTTKLMAGSVVVEVGDEGPGVPPELERRVFERSVTGGKGTGLGLSLARSLVAVDGGRLELIRARPALFAIFLRQAEVWDARQRAVSGPA